MGVRVHQTFPLLLVGLVVSLFVLMPAAIKAQEDDGSATAIQFDGHIFDLPRSIADGFTAFIIDAPTENVGGGESLQPPRTEFRLQIYTDTVAAPPPVGWVSVYAASDLEGYAAYEQYERLLSIVSERPDLSNEETLPTLYPYQQSALPPDRYSEFFVNAAYLESEGYRGITFIYGRVIHIGDSQPVLFYRLYFEGISLDDKRYLSAQIEGLPGFIESLEGVTDLDDYIAQAQALFHEPVDEDIIAWLNQANLMFSSFDYDAEA